MPIGAAFHAEAMSGSGPSARTTRARASPPSRNGGYRRSRREPRSERRLADEAPPSPRRVGCPDRSSGSQFPDGAPPLHASWRDASTRGVCERDRDNGGTADAHVHFRGDPSSVGGGAARGSPQRTRRARRGRRRGGDPGARGADTQTATNAAAVAVPAGGTAAPDHSPGSLYPSPITISGLTGTTTKVTVQAERPSLTTTSATSTSCSSARPASRWS